MYNRITLLLMLALIHDPYHGHDKKTRKKLSIKLLKKVKPTLQSTILRPVIESPTPAEEVHFHIRYSIDMIDISLDLAQKGYDGFVIVANQELYPIKIHMPDALERCGDNVGAEYLEAAEQELLEDREWVIKNEQEVKNLCAKQCSVLSGYIATLFEVRLFITRGFTGISTPYIFEEAHGKLTQRFKSA